jgi:peptide-methionine (R)-S-oxide reductase
LKLSRFFGTKPISLPVERQVPGNQETSMSAIKRDQLPTSDAEWKARLTPEQYQVTRKAGTEPAFTGEYWDCHEDGTYACVCCGEKLFSSEHKFESGSGWPSFFRPAADGVIDEETDRSYGMVRTEVRCGNCGAHLGHLFPDGPNPTGQRYCINSASLRLEDD